MAVRQAACYAAHVKRHAFRPRRASGVSRSWLAYARRKLWRLLPTSGGIFCTVRSASPIQGCEQAGGVTFLLKTPQLLTTRRRREGSARTHDARRWQTAGSREGLYTMSFSGPRPSAPHAAGTPAGSAADPGRATWRYLGDRAAADTAYCARFGTHQAPEPSVAPGGILAYPLPAVDRDP